MFPREVMTRFPLLPLEEEGRLNDMPLRENVIERVFANCRWTEMPDKEPTPGGLVAVPPVQDRQVPQGPQRYLRTVERCDGGGATLAGMVLNAISGPVSARGRLSPVSVVPLTCL